MSGKIGSAIPHLAWCQHHATYSFTKAVIESPTTSVEALSPTCTVGPFYLVVVKSWYALPIDTLPLSMPFNGNICRG